MSGYVCSHLYGHDVDFSRCFWLRINLRTMSRWGFKRISTLTNSFGPMESRPRFTMSGNADSENVLIDEYAESPSLTSTY